MLKLMRCFGRAGGSLAWLVIGCAVAAADDPPAVSARALAIHRSGLLIDGHNDLPWRLREEVGDLGFTKLDLSRRLDAGQTDLPRLRAGGVKGQFWSVYIPTNQPNPARTVTEQIDLVHRLVERYPDDLALALSAADIERAAAAGKIASLIGIEGGIAIEGSLAQLRGFYRQGARYMTLTHSETLDWADSATDDPQHGGLTEFGERVVREMNRLGMLVDLSHVSADTMRDALRVARAPVIFSHSSAYAIAPHPRNVPDEILPLVKANGGVIMVNFFSGFVVPEYARAAAEARVRLRAEHHDNAAYRAALTDWYKNEAPKFPRGTVANVADHIDHLVKVAGIDHVGIGSDFDGVSSVPVGLEDVASYPRLTQVLLDRGYDEAAIHKILGGNLLRVFHEAEEAARELQRNVPPEVDALPPKLEQGP
jgi:membrane dipeptidase